MIKFILSILLIANTSMAQVTYLKKDVPAPYTGYLFTEDKELQVRIKISQYDTLEQLTKKQDELIVILNDRVENQLKQNGLLMDELRDRKNVELWQSLGFFVLGAVVTGFIAGQVSSNGK